MSLDYPNRADWLAVRCTKRRIHLAKRIHALPPRKNSQRLGKAANKALKRQRMAKMYDAWLDTQDLSMSIWCRSTHRQERDRQLGSRRPAHATAEGQR